MKLIDAELLRKEIEFAKTVYAHPNRVVHGVADAFRQDGRAAMCDDILKKIDSLQQEQPEVDLEKEIDNVIADYSFVKTIDSGGFKTTVLDYAKIARHFYELGKQAMKQQMLKDAEPAEIGYFNQRGLSILTEKAIERMPVSEGDKVRIIIVKED